MTGTILEQNNNNRTMIFRYGNKDLLSVYQNKKFDVPSKIWQNPRLQSFSINTQTASEMRLYAEALMQAADLLGKWKSEVNE